MSVKVTVGIPTYNRKDYLKQALDSVVAQEYDNLEIIVSDNHSNDGTEEMLKDYMAIHQNTDIKYYRMDKNLGATLNWENCHEKATGEYLIILSDDDALEPGAVANMVEAFEPDVVQVIGNVIVIDGDGKELQRNNNTFGKYDGNDFWDCRLNKKLHDTPSAVMFRKKEAEPCFEIAKSANAAGDLALSLLLCDKGYIKCIDEYVVRYRIHEGNDTKNFYRCAKSHLDLYQLFKSRNISLDKIKWLRRYCYHVIGIYAKWAFMKCDLILMIKILRLLDRRLDYNMMAAWIKLIPAFCKREMQKFVG